MALVSTAVDHEMYYALEVDEETGRYYISFPVSNRMVDYVEYYEIDQQTYERYLADLPSALPFVVECKRHQHDDLLLFQPGSDRGTPWGL